jgi:hypothetical protein
VALLRPHPDWVGVVEGNAANREFRQIAHGPVSLAGQMGHGVTYQICEGCQTPIIQQAATSTIMVSMDRSLKHEAIFDLVARSLSRDPTLPVAAGARRMRAIGLSFDTPVEFALVSAALNGPSTARFSAVWSSPWRPCADEYFKARSESRGEAGPRLERLGRHESVVDGMPIVDLEYGQYAASDMLKGWLIHTGPLDNGGVCGDGYSRAVDEKGLSSAEQAGLDNQALIRLTVEIAKIMARTEPTATAGSSTTTR